jgi:hypothetical protein
MAQEGHYHQQHGEGKVTRGEVKVTFEVSIQSRGSILTGRGTFKCCIRLVLVLDIALSVATGHWLPDIGIEWCSNGIVIFIT